MAKRETNPRVAQFVEMCDFPCTKQELLLAAEECEFPDDVINVCEDLPNKTYKSEDEVMEAVEQVKETPTRQEQSDAARRFQ